MLSKSNTIEPPAAQAKEPPQWHVYLALVQYAKANPSEAEGLYFCNKLFEAHRAYVNVFDEA